MNQNYFVKRFFLIQVEKFSFQTFNMNVSICSAKELEIKISTQTRNNFNAKGMGRRSR